MTTSSAFPSIVVDTPGTSTSTASTPRAGSQQQWQTQPSPAAATPVTARPVTPTINTSIPTKPRLNRSSSIRSTHSVTSTGQLCCYLCDEQNPGDFSPTLKYLETCLLCSRQFCPIHKSSAPAWDQVCNINHSTYYHSMLEQAKKELGVNADKRELAEVLIAEGIYPSLGEREKAIFATSPVSASKAKELEAFRSLDAQIAQGSARGKGQVEEVDVVGADIAV